MKTCLLIAALSATSVCLTFPAVSVSPTEFTFPLEEPVSCIDVCQIVYNECMQDCLALRSIYERFDLTACLRNCERNNVMCDNDCNGVS
ncbi:hypothetical protein LSAT2_022532 [Lamellibrachia satsuma]|nr:hypothetical protein LSAT2_022532 [Lamellibrachia satsuma]